MSKHGLAARLQLLSIQQTDKMCTKPTIKVLGREQGMAT